MLTQLLPAFAMFGLSGPPVVSMNGKVISKNVKVIGGAPYVSLADIASAFKLSVQKTANGYKLIAPGGAGPLNARIEGNIEDDLFTGDWRFTVKGFKVVESYQPVYSGEHYTYGPKAAGESIVVVDCRLKSGCPAKELIEFAGATGKPINSQLTDNEEHGYEPFLNDLKLDYYSYARYILPGSAIDFAVAFSIPKGATPKDFIFSVHRYDDAKDKKTTLRIHLKK